MMITRLHFKRSIIAGALLATFCTPVLAASPNPKQEIADLRRLLEEATKQLAAQRQAIAEQGTLLAEHKRVLAALQAKSQSAPQAAATAPRQGATAPAEKPRVAASAVPPGGPVGRSPEGESAKPPQQLAAVSELRGVLTPKNTLVLEPSLQYAQSSSNRVALLGYTILPAITIGVIDIRNVNRDTFVGSLAARYGLTNRFEIEARLPYVNSRDTTVSRPFGVGGSVETITDSRGSGVGDAEFSLRYQLNEGGGDQPYFIGNLRAKTRTGKGPLEVPVNASGLQTELPTGSGFWGIQPSLTAIFPSDPAVFYGSASYLWNVKRSVAAYGDVDPGDAVGFNFGMGLALNDKASVSLGYDHSIIGKTKVQPGSLLQVLPTRTHVGAMNLGYSYRLSEKTTLNLSLAAGLTEAAPDVQLTLRLPTSF